MPFSQVVLNMAVCGVLVWCPYQFLIEVTMLLMVVMTYPFLASFVWLRISQPDVPRAFRVPGGACVPTRYYLRPSTVVLIVGSVALHGRQDNDPPWSSAHGQQRKLCCGAAKSERAREGGTQSARMRLLALTCCARCDDPAAGTCAGTVAAVLWTLPPALLGTAYIYVCIFVEVDHSFGAEKTPFSEPF
jgi:hypothetical protein